MIRRRAASERGRAMLGWLDSRHTFSFGDYYDPDHMGFRALRVINEDRVEPGKGFGTHSHRDMEIVSYVLDGALEHRDSMGNGSIIKPGEVQRMTAGTGVRHSETNPSPSEPVHFLQIWILPERSGIEPSYEQRAFPEPERRGTLRRVADRDGRGGAVTIHQDAELYIGLLESGESVVHSLGQERHAWVQVARGAVDLNGVALAAGDGAAVSSEGKLELRGSAPGSEILVFDLA